MVHINPFPRSNKNNSFLNGMQVFSFYRKNLHTSVFANNLLSSYTSVDNCLHLKLPDFCCQALNTCFILLRYLADFLYGIANLHGA